MLAFVLPSRRGCTALICVAIFCFVSLASSPASADPVEVALIGVHDFHESLPPPATPPAPRDPMPAQFAGTIEMQRAVHGDASTLVLSTGDILRQSGDQNPQSLGYVPTLCVLNALELRASAVGNHEFHYGVNWSTNGWATPLKTTVSTIADFSFLSSNITKSNVLQFATHEIFEVSGLKVAVIGATTRDTPLNDPRMLLWGLKFSDPVAAVNATAASLKAQPDPPDIIVAAYHEGASPIDGGLTGDPIRIYNDTSADVDVIFAGHTHVDTDPMDGPIPGEPVKKRPVVQGKPFGQGISEVVLTVDSATGDVLSYTKQHVGRTDKPRETLVAQYDRVAEVDDIANAPRPMSSCPQ